MSSSLAQRAARWQRIQQKPLDLLVVGGGISGAGVLREAARRGWHSLLIEQQDFAWGSSSRSSKLVHGGLRYLAQGDLRTTWQSVRERQRLMQEAPALITAQSFMFAMVPGRKPGRHTMKAGLALYDWMAGEHGRAELSLAEARQLAPGLAPQGMIGALLYRDAKTDDARLVMRVLQEARQDGGLMLNYVRAEAPVLQQGQVVGLQVRDALTGQSVELKASAVINATGVWADGLRAPLQRAPLLRPLRGSHLIVPFWRLPVAQSISLMHPQDGRPVFFYPWEGCTLIGTTDLDHQADLSQEASITPAEVDYLLAAVNDQFPDACLCVADVLSCYAGVRPVVDDGQAAPSAVGRDHVVMSEQGLITLTGGKLTTFRRMALDALALAARQRGLAMHDDGAAVFRPEAALPPSLDACVRQRLKARYGARALAVLQDSQPGDLEPVAGTDTLWLELRQALRAEDVVHLDDLLLRRVRLGLLLPQGGLGLPGFIDRVKALCQQYLGWSEDDWDLALGRYRDIIRRHYALPGSMT
ncbi:MAG: glycerol-3-phosphate dehydrogenase/oxidase [Paucibacter sp.]|nr:glycerol-3-phosphate dehydrogenase/oxidase [Roseateles sp.]